MHSSRKKFFTLTGFVLLLAAGWKLIFLVWDKFPFNSDEAIVALMARHILGGERPIFFYGQSYMGSLDAWFVAAGFLIFGQHVWVIRFVQTVLYLGVIATTIWITYLITANKRSALVSGLLLAIPIINVMLYTTVSLGGYNEALLFGNILIILAIKIRQMLQKADKKLDWLGLVFLWGVFSGLGFWANAMSLIYVFPTLVYLIWGWRKYHQNQKNRVKLHQAALFAATGLLLGSTPIWIYGFQIGLINFITEMIHFGLPVGETDFLGNTVLHIRNLFVLGTSVIFGIRPPWAIQWLMLPLIPFNLFAWGKLIWDVSKKGKNQSGYIAEERLLLGIGTALILVFIFANFGSDPSGRYFLPLYILSAIIFGKLFSGTPHKIHYVCLGTIVIFNFLSTFQCALTDSTGITTQFSVPSTIDHSYDAQLIDFLSQEGEYYGYSNYWVSYPLAFLTSEQIIYTPRIPYHTDKSYTERDDRYKPYQVIVEQSDHPAYITTRQTEMDGYIRESLNSLGVTWQEKTIGDYIVFYHLSQTVRPMDIGLGFSRE